MMSLVTSFLALVFFLVFSLLVSGDGSCGAECCQKKVVGGIAYTLAYVTENRPAKCNDRCVYTADQEPLHDYVCFGPGNLSVTNCSHCKPLPGMQLLFYHF